MLMMHTLGTILVNATISSALQILTIHRRQRYQSMHFSSHVVFPRNQCLPKYPFADYLFADAIIRAGAIQRLLLVSTFPALLLRTYQHYDKGVQNGVNRSGNHQDVVARNAMRADVLVPEAMDRSTPYSVRRKHSTVIDA